MLARKIQLLFRDSAREIWDLWSRISTDISLSLSLFFAILSCHDIYLILDVYGYIEQKIVRVTAAIWINISHARDGINDRLWRCFNFNDIRRSIDWKEGKVVVEGHDGKSMFPGGMKPCHEECQTHDNREENISLFCLISIYILSNFCSKNKERFFYRDQRRLYEFLETNCANPWSVYVKFKKYKIKKKILHVDFCGYYTNNWRTN